MKRPLANNWSYAYGQGDTLPDEIDMTMASWATGPQPATVSYTTPPADTKTTKFDVDVSKAGKKPLCRKCSRYGCFILLAVLFLLSLLALAGVLITWGLLTDGFKTVHEKIKDDHQGEHQTKSIFNDESASDVCDTAECAALAFSIDNRLNRDVDPCTDFLNYSCRQDKYTFVDTETIFYKFGRTTDNQLKTLLEETSTFNDTDNLVLAKLFYRMCLDVEKIHSDSTRPLVDMIRTLGGCPMIDGSTWNANDYKWEHVSAILIRKYGIDSPLGFVVEPNNRNTTLNVIKIAPTSESPINNKVSMTYGSNRKLFLYQASYQDAIFKILKSIGKPPDDMEQQIRDTLLFEAHLVSKIGPPENPTSATGNVNFFSLSELGAKYSHIDWPNLVEEVFRGITTINPNEDIFYVPDQSYLAFVNDMIKQTDKKILANFQLLSFIKAYISYVLPLTNDADIKNRWMDCVDETTNFFPWTLSSEYVKTIRGTRIKDEVELIVQNIGRALKKKIKKFAWMNGPVTDMALYKIDGLSYRIIYPEFIVNHRYVASHENIKLHVNNDSYAELVAQLAAQNVASSFSRIKTINDLDQWDYDSYPVIPDISLDLKTNTIVVTAAALQEPIFSIRYPKYVLYSRAGYLIAKALWEVVSPAAPISDFVNSQSRRHLNGDHQYLTHVLLYNTGSFYDSNGNWIQWYTNATYESYNEVANCFLGSSNTSTKLPASVKSELIAQSVALDLAFQAYKIYLKDTSRRKEKSLDDNLDSASYSEIFALSFFSMICDQKQTQNVLLTKSDSESSEYKNFIMNSMLNNAKLVDRKTWNCSSSASKVNPSRYLATTKDQCV